MKRILSIVMVMLLICLGGCGAKTPAEPDDATIKSDIQEYINEMLDENAEIDIYEKTGSESAEDSLTITCNVLYSSDAGENQGKFVLTYTVDGKEWVLSKCRVELEGAEEEEAEETKESSSGEMSDELYDFTFELDDVVYQLPFAYSELIDNGWTISSTGVSEQNDISANSYEGLYMAKSGNEIYVNVINMSGNTKKIKECKVGGIEVYRNNILDVDLFRIAKGITTGSTIEEITDAFGAANSTNEYDDYSVVTYTSADYVEAKFYCYKEDLKYNQIVLRNYVSDESDVTETSTEVPEYLSQYKKPTELGNDVTSGIVEIEDELYCMPAPVSEFIDNGWNIKSKSNAVGAGNNDSLTLEKDGVSMYVSIMNFANYQTIPENCAVYRVDVYDTDRISITLPQNISFSSTKADVEAIITDDFSYYKGTSDYMYTYDNYDIEKSIGIDINIGTEKVSSLEVSMRKWMYE